MSPGIVICISGSVGVGKTWLAKGIASAFAGIDVDHITSPAFNSIREYRGAEGRRVTHIDFYRLDEINCGDMGLFDDSLDDHEALRIVEGGEQFLSSLVDSYLHIKMVADPDDEDARVISVAPVGNIGHARSLLHKLES